jgi:hypothetical protein
MTETAPRAVWDAWSNDPCPEHGDYHCRACAAKARQPADTGRIRWTGERRDTDPAFTGSAGTVGPSLFQVYAPDGFAPQWILTTSFPGMEDKRSYADDPEALKAEAERWLEEFVASLGAIFPDALREVIKMERDAQDGLAAEHAEYGRDARSEQCYAEVKTLDWTLALMDRIAQEAAPTAAGEKE